MTKGAHDRSAGSERQIGRREALRFGGYALAGAAIGTASAVTIEEYGESHPKPAARISPLVQDNAVNSTVVVWRGSGTDRRVALTFDDGPDPQWTPMVVDMLHVAGAKATFFMLGDSVAKYPTVAQMVADAGHEIGSHSWDHRHPTTLSAAEFDESLQRTHNTIESVTSQSPTIVRPPYGQFDAETIWSMAEMNYSVVLWSHRMNSDNPWDRAQENIQTAAPGMIMLSHDGRTTASNEQMKAAGWLITQMQKSGWEFVSVSELLRPGVAH